MFWIIFVIVFLALCAGWILIVRGRTAGGLRRTDENHNAVQNGTAKMYAQRYRDGNGPTPPLG